MKTTWSLALVAGAGSVLATAPPAYDPVSSAPPAYGPSSEVAAFSSSLVAYSSVVASSVYASSASVAVSAIPSVSGGPLPTCWTECFEANAVASEADLCGNDAVSACVHDGCSAEDDKAYWSWYDSFCPASSSGSAVVVVASETSAIGGEPSGPVIVTNTIYNTKYVCPCETADPTRTPGEVYVTHFTTEYETTCPGNEPATQTYTYGDWTSIYTSYSLTTTTEIITATITHPSYPSSPVDPETSSIVAYPSWGASSGVEPISSGYVAPSGYPASSGGAIPSGSGSLIAYPSSSGGPISGSGLPYPSSSGAAPYPYPSGSGSASYYPSGSGVSYSSSYFPTGVSSSAYPTSTGDCVPCQGQPGKNPEEWCGYDIHDNWYAVTPKTCKTVEYTWTITSETISPDGVPVNALIVNGQMPGPMIEANWGDEIVVHLTNGLPNNGANGTSLHFHGIRQNGTNEMDGVSSITQCPIAPGHSMTYRWTATSYGTSWWHSHYALQTYTGIFGPMIIHGPAAAEYDAEQMVMLQDWNHIPVTTLYEPSQIVGGPSSGPQTLDSGLINGMNVFPGATGGQRFEMTVQSGKSYRIRLVNSAIQSTFVFYVDQHELEVIAMDFVPITPYTTNMVVINIGQRYDIILKADQPSGDYWLRSDNQQPCGQLKNLDIKGIVHYADGPGAEPTSQPYGYAPTCLDEPYEKLNPIVPWDAGAASDTINEAAVIGPYPGTNLFKWTLSGTTFFAEWDHPTLQQIYEDGTVPTTSGNLAIEVPDLHEWVYVIIQTPIPLPHPIHLHGHDFLILAQGLGAYDSSVALNLKTPPRRDVAVIPADPTQGQAGYLVLAFQTSNPGVWLLHCHIGWVSRCPLMRSPLRNVSANILDSTTQWASHSRSSRTSRASPTRSSTAGKSRTPVPRGPTTPLPSTLSPPTLECKRSMGRRLFHEDTTDLVLGFQNFITQLRGFLLGLFITDISHVQSESQMPSAAIGNYHH